MNGIEKEKKNIVIKPIEKNILVLKIRALEGSTLIVHRLDPKTVEDFTIRETGKPEIKKFRDFDKEYESCFHYTHDGKYGFPVAGIRGAILYVAVSLKIPRAHIKRSVRILGVLGDDIAELKYEKLNRRVDNPRRSGISGTPDIRHRPEFFGWSMVILIEYEPNLISPDQVINLVNRAGSGSGLGEWRPSSPKSPGTHGRFEVERTKTG